MDLKVETYSGVKADERPLRLIINGHTVGVLTILDRWFGEDHDYFKVEGEDLRVYLLRRDRSSDLWELRSVSDPGF